MRNKDAKLKFDEADRLYREGKCGEALELLNELDAAFPNDRKIMFPRARCLAKLYRGDEAVALCDRLIDEFQYDKARELKARVKKYGNTADAPTGDLDDISFDALNIGLDDDEESAFAQAGLAPYEESKSWGSTVFVTVLVIGVLVGGYFVLFRDKGGTSAPSASSTSEPTTQGMVIDKNIAPEKYTHKSSSSSEGVTVNSSIGYEIYSDCGTPGNHLSCFQENFRNCEPSLIQLSGIPGLTFQYEVFPNDQGACFIRLTITQADFEFFESYQGKDMVCPCDSSEDFMTLSETLGERVGLNDLDMCAGSLVEAVRANFAAAGN